jgi:LPXTG-motif cell wall-anchored protein
MKEPKDGFSDPNLKAVFAAQQATSTSPPSGSTVPAAIPSTSAKEHKTSTGAIAGGVVAAVAGIAIIIGLAAFLLRRKRQQAIQLPVDGDEHQTLHEKDANMSYEMMAKQGSSVELAGNRTHELPAVVPVYELSGGNSRVSSRQHERFELESRDGSNK